MELGRHKVSGEGGAEFSALLRRYRLALGLTQEELAERAQMSAHSISNLERGARHTPRENTLLLLSKALQLGQDDEREFYVAAKMLKNGRATGLHITAPHVHAFPEAPATRLIGRDRVVRDVYGSLTDPHTRLLTLTGPAGVGKTRVAQAVAQYTREAETPFFDGVVFVPCAGVTDPDLLPGAIARAFGLHEATDKSILTELGSITQMQTLLLVLDNFEHLTSSALIIIEVLGSCANLKALITSRIPLNVSIERRIDLPPLPCPPIGFSQLSDVMQSPAVQLFTERAQAVQSTFVLTTENAEAVATVCHQLDGLPLALELAAGRMALLSPQTLLARYSAYVIQIKSSTLDRPERHQTLRHALAWSYDSLPKEAQRVFRALGVFAGGCTLEMAIDVYADAWLNDQPPGDTHLLQRRRFIEDELLRLREQSLLQRTEGTSVDSALPDVRIWLLSTVREYASLQLIEMGERETVAQAHAWEVLAFAEKAEAHLRGPQQQQWMDHLERDIENIRAALHWLTERNHIALGLRLASALWQFWAARGYVSEGRQWLERLISCVDDMNALETGDTFHNTRSANENGEDWHSWLAKALNGAGVLASRQSEYATALAFHERAITLRRALGDQLGIASSLNNMGGIAMEQANYARAKALWEESLVLRRAIGEPRAIALALSNLGGLAHYRNQNGQAVTLLEEALHLFREVGDDLMRAMTLNNLGAALYQIGEIGQGQRRVEESLALARRLHSQRDEGRALNNLAHMAYQQGRNDEAKARAEESLALHRELGDLWYQADDLALLGTIAFECGDFTTAEARLYEAFDLRQAITHREGIADSLARFGALARTQGKWERGLADFRDALQCYAEVEGMVGMAQCLEAVAGALCAVNGERDATTAVRLCGLAEALRHGEPPLRPPSEQVYYEQALALGRASLGDDQFAAAWTAGASQAGENLKELMAALDETLSVSR